MIRRSTKKKGLSTKNSWNWVLDYNKSVLRELWQIAGSVEGCGRNSVVGHRFDALSKLVSGCVGGPYGVDDEAECPGTGH